MGGELTRKGNVVVDAERFETQRDALTRRERDRRWVNRVLSLGENIRGGDRVGGDAGHSQERETDHDQDNQKGAARQQVHGDHGNTSLGWQSNGPIIAGASPGVDPDVKIA